MALVTQNPARKPAGGSSPLNSAVKSVVKAPFKFRRDLCRQPKTRVSGQSCGVVCVILRLDVLIQYRCMTDGKTDRQTDGRTHDYDGQYHASIASRGKNSHGDCFIWFLNFLSCLGSRHAHGSSWYARTISRHTDGISQYSVPASAGPLLPLHLTVI